MFATNEPGSLSTPRISNLQQSAASFSQWVGDGEMPSPTYSGQGSFLDLDFGGTFQAVEESQRPWLRMYAGIFPREEAESEFYSETQCSGDSQWAIAEDDLISRRICNMGKIRPWGSPRTSAGKWACRANYYESHWFRLDMLINGAQMFALGSAQDLTISKRGPMALALQHPASNDMLSGPDLAAYLKAVSDAAFGSHRLVNRVQAEFAHVFEGLHRVLSHVPLAHAYSDLATVEELITAAQGFLSGMSYLVQCEHHARQHMDSTKR
ncbi:hypothetical protein M422DRAFT_47760 [Sphaerobolus stellatus SS14]|uniref:Uncharacterized protein n=1 Tax=Sphaerobolus stellatus (strain SS14) TaxID=990650 RepID=A0A0C9UKS1_SPHS4|nr:hypothetical protein M422DRAFT_47760 [Sphaerobolus stellatus SS14]